MTFAKHSKLAKTPAIALAVSLGLVLSGCGGMATNRSLYSTNQPVVEQTNYTFDVQTGQGGLDISERQRLAAWFDTVELGYGDRVTIEDPMSSEATRDAVSELAGRHGVLVSDVAPVTEGYVEPGFARVVLTRSKAHVPGCPNWSAKSDMNYNNATSPGYGCSVNSNMAAMIANPQDLLKGQEGTGETVIMSSTKAIDSYRKQAPTGAGGVKKAGGN